MLLYKLIVLTFCFFQYSTSFNSTTKFENIIFPERFANHIQNYVSVSANTISKPCKSQLIQYGTALSNFEPWALLMFDAGSKIPSGLLTGNWVGLGNFDECLKISKTVSLKTIYGKHCVGQIPIFNSQGSKSNNRIFSSFKTPETRLLNPEGFFAATFATCLPDSCTTDDIQHLYSWTGMNIKFDDSMCQTKATQPKLTGGDIATISFLSIILAIMLVATVYDVYLFYFNKKPAHFTLIAFSILTNGRKLIATGKSSSQISCLHGMRVISMMWVILSHRYTISAMLPKRNSFYMDEWMNDAKNMFIMGATVSVDTFFVLGGLVVSYGFMSAMAKGIKFNIIAYYFHRYLRLTPLLAVIILIYVTILKHLGSGPLWNFSLALTDMGCNEYWWSALLYVQNYVNKESMCVGQTWYLSVDTQLFLLSPIILVPLKKVPYVGILTATFCTVLSILASFLIAWIYEIHGLLVGNQDDSFNLHYYYATHTRAGPWLMGIILGYYIYKIKRENIRLPINKTIAVVLWVISLTILSACVFSGHNTLTVPYDRLANAFFVSLLRPGWTVGLSWVIIACVTGYGGPINWFLSLPVFQVVSKLTYSMYLIHFAIQIIITGQMRSAPVFSNLEMMYTFWGDLIFTLATSLIFTLAFESPVIVIEKLIFGNDKDRKTKETEKDDKMQKVEVA